MKNVESTLERVGDISSATQEVFVNKEMRSVFALENFGRESPWKWPVLALRESVLGRKGKPAFPPGVLRSRKVGKWRTL